MTRQRSRTGLLIGAGVFFLTASLLLLFTREAKASRPHQETEAYCLGCHNNPDLKMTLPGGDELSLYVSPEALNDSVHSPIGIECGACHTDIKSYPHPENTFTTTRELARSYYESCRKCHSAIYDKAQDSMHARVSEDNPDAPVCTDCHGAHTVKKPNQPRTLISTTCSQCHNNIFEIYQSSIHGADLIDLNNPDVPVCTDCHGVHNIQDPRTVEFRIQSPEMCADCHADAELMAKYDLPANVYNIYKLSWHGVDVSVFKSRWPTIWHDSAVCTDCHGIHDIYSTEDSRSSVHGSNLLATCQKCHPSAGPNWTAAWTGHNEISLARTPLLFYTNAFYNSLIPVVLWVAGIYVGLQILRSLIDRVRRSLP